MRHDSLENHFYCSSLVVWEQIFSLWSHRCHGYCQIALNTSVKVLVFGYQNVGELCPPNLCLGDYAPPCPPAPSPMWFLLSCAMWSSGLFEAILWILLGTVFSLYNAFKWRQILREQNYLCGAKQVGRATNGSIKINSCIGIIVEWVFKEGGGSLSFLVHFVNITEFVP